MNTIVINGKSVITTGRNIYITNNTVIVDGQIVNDGLSGIVEIKFECNLASLNVKHGNATILKWFKEMSMQAEASIVEIYTKTQMPVAVFTAITSWAMSMQVVPLLADK